MNSLMLIRVLFLLALLLPSVSQAVTYFSSDFEGANPEADGWAYSQGWCNFGQPSRTDPCTELDDSTDLAHAGSKSLKGTYSAAWSDPNPQTHEQAISQHFSGTTNIYTRYWYRTTGFTYTAVSGTKHLYYKNDAGGVPTFFSIHWFGDRNLGFAGQQIASQTCPSGSVGTTCNFYPNGPETVPMADDTWYCVEEHINLGTANQANGSIEVWVNGLQTLGYYNRPFLTSATAGQVIDWLQIFKQNGDGLMYYDQVVAANSRIGGCGGTAPVTDTTSPSTPTGLAVN